MGDQPNEEGSYIVIKDRQRLPFDHSLKTYGAPFIDITLFIKKYVPSDLYWLKQLQLHAPNLHIDNHFRKKLSIEVILLSPKPIKNPGVSDLIVTTNEEYHRGRGVIYLELEQIPNMTPLEYSFKLAEYVLHYTENPPFDGVPA